MIISVCSQQKTPIQERLQRHRCLIRNLKIRNRARAGGRGSRGSPAIRPGGGRGRNKATRTAEMYLDGEAEALVRKAVELAFAGDPAAMRLCLARTIAPRRERPVAIALPPIRCDADIAPAIAAITEALAKGVITTGQAAELSQMLDTFVRAVDASEFDRRLTLLENGRAPGL
jgi:hypothetical protein